MRKKPLNNNFLNAQENGESSWDAVPKDNMVQVSKQILKGNFTRKGGVSLNSVSLILINLLVPPGKANTYTQQVPCYGDPTEQLSESQGGLTKSLQGHTPASSSLFVDILPVSLSLLSVCWKSSKAAQKSLLWENQGKMKYIMKYTKNHIKLKGEQKYIRKGFSW